MAVCVSTHSLCSYTRFTGNRSWSFAHLHQCSVKVSVFWAEGRCKPLPPDIKPETPTLTAASCSSITELVSGVSDKRITLLGYSVALHLCLQRPSIMETQCFCCLCRQGQAGIEGCAAAHGEGRKRIPLPWLSVWSGLPFPSHSPPSSHQTGTSSVTFPAIAFLSPEACRAPWTAGVL